MGVRTTDLGVASHRRLVLRTVIGALTAVFGATYPREPQFQNLKVTPDYPLVLVDYPCVVVEYEPQRVVNAGVGHEEWFPDANMVMRKWNHSRFEGSLNFNVFGLSPLDRDLLSDAVTEVIRFGRLDAHLLPFFDSLYGASTDPVKLMFSQLMLNADEIDFGGDSASPAPWQPEDILVYETTMTTTIHGGFYNVLPIDTFGYVTRAKAEPYPQGTQEATIEFGPAQPLPFPDPGTVWTNPLEFVDADIPVGVAVISGVDTLN